tara:strand:- start:828 stop:944 length:117 start_codon:yes stop_codon:yes gene_type:complete
MYKKGKIREERINRKDIVEVGDVFIENNFYNNLVYLLN